MLLGCPTPRGFALIDGVRRPRPCRRLLCPGCGPRTTLSTVKAIALARPHSSAVITMPHDSTPEGDRARLRAFASVLGSVASDLRADGLVFEYCWVLELSTSLRPNVHVLSHGDVVSSSRFRAALSRAGGQGDIQTIRHLKIVSRYVLKLPLSGLDDPNVDAAAAMDLHLALNGQRLLHSSRRFWRNGATELSGVRAARRVARSKPTGSAPTPEQLAAWHANWKLPPTDGTSVPAVWAPSAAQTPRPEGEARVTEVRRLREP